MKLHKLLMAALLVAGVFFITGCGNDKKDAAPATDSPDAAIKAVADACMDTNVGSGEMSNVEFAKINKVNDTYAVVCYSAKLKEKGRTPFAVHVKKNGSTWKVVDVEDNWEPKERHK